MEGFVFLLLGLVVAALVGAVAWWSHIHTQERRRVWRSVAERRGGAFHLPEWRLFRSTSEAIEVTVGHAIVRLDLYVVSTGKSSTTYTRARARYALGSGPSFQVYEEGFFSSLGKALGTQDLEIGDPAFDAVFMVKGDDVASLQTTWTTRARAILMQTLRQTRAEANGAEVKLVALGALTNAGHLDAMLDLAGELASVGARPLDALAELPGAALTPVAGAWDEPTAPHVRISTERGDVRADLRVGPSAPRLRLSLPTAQQTSTFSVDIVDGRADGLPRGMLTERAAGLLRAIEGTTLASDGAHLRLSWSSVPPPQTAAEGAALLAELAAGSRSVGAFR